MMNSLDPSTAVLQNEVRGTSFHESAPYHNGSQYPGYGTVTARSSRLVTDSWQSYAHGLGVCNSWADIEIREARHDEGHDYRHAWGPGRKGHGEGHADDHRQSHREELRDPDHARERERFGSSPDQGPTRRLRHDELRSRIQEHGFLHQPHHLH